jgi:TPP-dependent pyruvate/acetoin dehydrogenase alpha subunit
MNLTTDQLLGIYRQMVTIRCFEDRLYQLFLQGQVVGTLHQYQGQEAVAVGVCQALQPTDIIFSTHRPVGHAIAKGVPLKSIAAEIWGKEAGCAGGKGGQMHLTDVGVGMMPSNAIVGANIPIAAGAALSFKMLKTGQVALSFFGDGASNTGAFHEGLNLAAVKQVPVVFICENNQYAASTHTSLVMKIEDIASRASAYGMPGLIVDGMDVLQVYKIALEAVSRARMGQGPTLIEAKTYRFMGHSRGDPGKYRSAQELEDWRRQDPIHRFRAYLEVKAEITLASMDQVDKEVSAAVEDAVQFAMSTPEPSPGVLNTGVFAESRRRE